MGEGQVIREIKDSKELHNFLLSSGLHSASYGLFDFYTKYKNISVGCGCSRKAREEIANRAYMDSICNLTEEQKAKIKSATNADIVRFYLNQGIFAEIK